MFRENQETRTPIWRDVLIKAVFLGVFIVLLLWLFPMPKVEPLLDSLFNQNINTMKEAAEDYYTNERLPKEIGSKDSMTLNDMLSKKLLLPFVDGNGEQCDVDSSYVEVTKMDTEYILKVYLSCNSKSDYIIVHLGCHDLCNECDKTAVVAKKTTVKQIVEKKKEDPKDPDDPKKDTYLYEYLKAVEGYYTWSDWSAYSKTEVTATADKEVRTKEETEITNGIIGYNVYTYQEPILVDKLQQTGTITGTACVASGVKIVGTGEYVSAWSYEGMQTYNYSPKSTSTVYYEYVSSDPVSCSECATGVRSTYKKYVLKTYPVVQEQLICTAWDTKVIPKYIVVQEITGYNTVKKAEPVYGDIETKYTTYSFRTRSYTEGYTTTQWSKSKSDLILISQGYVYTGNYKKEQ